MNEKNHRPKPDEMLPQESETRNTNEKSSPTDRVEEQEDLIESRWFSGTGVDDRLYSRDITALGWIPTRVPGNVQADLEAVHHRKPLWYSAGGLRLTEAVQENWWYHRDFWERALHMTRMGEVDTSPLVSDVFAMEQWRAAFTRAAAGKGLKVVLPPGES